MTTPTYDAVIIGAGASGLYAAAILQQNDLSVAVLEARDRVGGRLLSSPVGDGRVDLGATWFWANEPRIASLIGQSDLGGFAQHTAGDMMYQPEAGDAQRMEGNQLGTPAGRLAAGMQSIPELLAEQLKSDTIRLATVAASVSLGNEHVDVTTTAGDVITAAHVVLAIPPALAMSGIDFGGDIPDLVAGLARSTPVWMGSTVKVVAVYERAFWRDSGLAGAAYSYSGPMREIHDMSGPDGSPAAIFGFCGLDVGQDAPTVDQVTTQLVELFGEQARTPVQTFIMDWRDEAFTSPANVERLTNYQTYGHPEFQKPTLGGRAHWSSTETSTVAPGHVEGAFAAAERAANNILTERDNTNPTGAS